MRVGGRGFLGFEAVSSIDPNHANRHAVTRTRYSQAFPLVGMPLLTDKVVSLGDFAAPACLSAITDACFLGNTGLSGFELSGRRLTSSTQVWDTYPAFSAAQQTPVQVRPAGTDESVFDYNDGLSVPGSGLVDGGVLTGVSTLFDYDAWGNVTLTEVSTHGGNPAQPESAVVTSNTYADDTARWRLGRLVESTPAAATASSAAPASATTWAPTVSFPVKQTPQK